MRLTLCADRADQKQPNALGVVMESWLEHQHYVTEPYDKWLTLSILVRLVNDDVPSLHKLQVMAATLGWPDAHIAYCLVSCIYYFFVC